jgi:hypothetical protein
MKKGNNTNIFIASAYSMLLCTAILTGLIFRVLGSGAKSVNAIDIPILAFLIALILGVCGYGIYNCKNWARISFIILCPFGHIALASVFSTTLWADDVPLTILAVIIYAPIVFTLTRLKSLKSFNLRNLSWSNRGGILVLSLVICSIIVLYFVKSTKNTNLSGYSFIAGLNYLGDFVRRLVICQLLLWHYVGALIAVSISIKEND